MMNLFDALFAEPFALKTDCVDSVASGVITDALGVRERVLDHHGISTHKSMFSRATKLVHSGIGADAGVVFNCHVSCQGCRIGHNYPVAYVTIVSNMGLRHKKTIAANGG